MASIEKQFKGRETTKSVKNRNSYKVELVINGKVVVFLPGKTVKIPASFVVPSNLGLYVK